jgi:hypothetical protein
VSFRGKELGISILRAQNLDKTSLCKITDLWEVNNKDFQPWEKARTNFTWRKTSISFDKKCLTTYLQVG